MIGTLCPSGVESVFGFLEAIFQNRCHQMLFQSNNLGNRIQNLKSEITNTEKSLVVYPGRRCKARRLTESTKVEVYNSIRHPINAESVPQTKVAKNNIRDEQRARADVHLRFWLGFGD